MEKSRFEISAEHTGENRRRRIPTYQHDTRNAVLDAEIRRVRPPQLADQKQIRADPVYQLLDCSGDAAARHRFPFVWWRIEGITEIRSNRIVDDGNFRTCGVEGWHVRIAADQIGRHRKHLAAAGREFANQFIAGNRRAARFRTTVADVNDVHLLKSLCW